MKKVLTMAGVMGMMTLAACNGSGSSNSAADAGRVMDSMVDQATSAVKGTADSASQAFQNAADSTKTAIDPATDSNK